MGLPGARFFAQRETTAERDSSLDSGDGEKDVALAFVGEHAQHIDPEVEKRVVRKIDLFLIPAMVIGMDFLPNS
jgi:hypothetical protein